MDTFETAIKIRKQHLLNYLQQPLQQLSQKIATVWQDQALLDEILSINMASNNILQQCHQIYTFDIHGIQTSSLIDHKRKISKYIGGNLSNRPYFNTCLADTKSLSLSRTYTGMITGNSSITVLQAVQKNSEIIGYIAIDFLLLKLPLADKNRTEDRRIWLQVKGDPSIRGTLFMQSRSKSLMDECLDDVNTIMQELIQSRGIFHAKLHYSSSRSTMWLYDDPFRYRVHVLDEMLNAVLLAYPARKYPDEAVVSSTLISAVFEQFKTLRNADEIIYLRAASLNIINGMVGLNFSCDGSHYMPVEEFLAKGEEFWFGTTKS